MRGSPIIRFIILAIALAATAFGLARVTASRGGPADQVTIIESTPTDSATEDVSFRLLLSDEATSVELDSGTMVRPAVGNAQLSGILRMDPKNPHVALLVKWKNPATTGEHRFAKLTLEPPGRETIQHVFDSSGDIDEFLELPVSK